MDQIHENLPPIHLPFFTIFDGIIIGTLFFGSLIVSWIFFKKIKALPKKVTQPTSFIIPSFNLAQEIKKLKKALEDNNWKDFSLRATQVLKKQCEQKFKKPFAFATGQEMEEILREKISNSDLQNIQLFFQDLDPIKFAQAQGQKKMAHNILRILENFK